MEVNFKPNPKATVGKERPATQTDNLVVYRDGKLHLLMVARYSRTASRVYCNVFVYPKNEPNLYGYAYAGGSGYHKESQAFQDAMLNAGYKFDQEIGGCGTSRVCAAMECIGRFYGYDNFILV
jgi:hypothetical protein